jgi:hypothetical protein
VLDGAEYLSHDPDGLVIIFQASEHGPGSKALEQQHPGSGIGII